MFDFLAYPLGKFLKFIYDITFENYGLAIIIFTFIVRLAMLPLTVKQHKSTMKMQELQPLINDIQKRYKDDREAMNQELMKLYQEHNYNPAGGCLPMLIQMPLILTLYWVIVQPLKFMLGKSQQAIEVIVEAAARAQATLNTVHSTINSALGTGGIAGNLPRTAESVMKLWGAHREIRALNFFNEHPSLLYQAEDMLKESELINFRSFLGLHLGETASFQPGVIFGPEWKTYLPLFILAILATVTTYLSSRLAMPKTDDSKDKASGCSANSMMYVGPAMTLLFSFQLPAGVVLYWMTGYVFAILQQLYINKYVMKKKEQEGSAARTCGRGSLTSDKKESTDDNDGKIDGGDEASAKQLPSGQGSPGKSKGKGKKSDGKKGGKKKSGKRKK